jgi:CheY-like chemotaxis protein
MAYRILVVDDHEDIREILKTLLTYHNYEVVEAPTAEEMLERLAGVDPDLVVLDIRLPGIDGCEALKLMRRRGFTKPILLYSEYYDLFAHHIRDCKPDGFFPKSKGPLVLLNGIQQQLANSARGLQI